MKGRISMNEFKMVGLKEGLKKLGFRYLQNGMKLHVCDSKGNAIGFIFKCSKNGQFYYLKLACDITPCAASMEFPNLKAILKYMKGFQ